MDEQKIKPKAMCLLIHDGKILVGLGSDKVTGAKHYRVIGGSLNFYERAEEGARREIREELHSELENLEMFKVVENLFTFEGNRGHEIIFLFKGDLVKKELYEQLVVHVVEDTYEFDAEWVPIQKILTNEIPLYPALDWKNML